jgi:AraC family transcriptional regulator
LARVLELMSARLAEPLTLDELAAEAGISKFHFVRQFKLSVGMTPHALLATLRFDAARTLLSGTDLGVGIIASRCGYARGSQLNAVFAKRLGMAPLAWRRRQRG